MTDQHWVEFKNGTRLYLDLITFPNESLHIVLKRKNAKRNAINQVLDLSQAKTTKGELN